MWEGIPHEVYQCPFCSGTFTLPIMELEDEHEASTTHSLPTCKVWEDSTGIGYLIKVYHELDRRKN